MYTEEYKENGNISISEDYGNENDSNEEKISFWNNNKGIIVKIAIIIICLIILVWLIMKLKGRDKEEVIDPTTYNNNVTTIRLAAEKYFFLNKNLPNDNETKVITLNTMNQEGLVGEIIDYNKKVCNIYRSYASLAKTSTSYVLKINLECNKENSPKEFMYNLGNYACQNCNGTTYMNGQSEENKDDNNDDNKNDNKYSCNEWSSWTDKKVNDSSLSVRTRTLFKAYKLGQRKDETVYGEWSDYSINPITGTDTLEVEASVQKQETWIVKTSNTKPTASENIRNITSEKISSGTYKYCSDGFTKTGDKKECYKTVPYSDYMKLRDKVKTCVPTTPKKNDDGTYTNMYICYKSLSTGTNTKTVYTYETKEIKDVLMYRSRTKTVKTTYGETVYTDYVTSLPSGYTKIANSDKTQYSYKLSVCEK